MPSTFPLVCMPDEMKIVLKEWNKLQAVLKLKCVLDI